MSGTMLPVLEWMAGGTDLSERRRSGVSRGEVRALPMTPAMREIAESGGGLRVGAGVSIQALADDPRVRDGHPGLAMAAGVLATPQVRLQATVGGNLTQHTRCWYYRHPHTTCLRKGGATCPARGGALPWGVLHDLGPCAAPHPSTLGAALMACEATVDTSHRTALRVDDVLGDGGDGTRHHKLMPGEVITTVVLPPPHAGEQGAYRRAAGRQWAEWPLVELVVRVRLERGEVTLARLVAGGVATVPLRLSGGEAVLAGRALDAAVVDRAVAASVEGMRPLPETGYKALLLQGLLRDALEAVGATSRGPATAIVAPHSGMG